jgi:hypothetical protein
LPGFFRFFALVCVTRCCGGLFATTFTARSKRSHAAQTQPLPYLFRLAGATMTDQPDYPWRGHGDRNSEYYMAVGFLCQQWNAVERLYMHLASDIIRRDRSQHDLIFRHLGIVAVGDFMAEYAARFIRAKGTREQLGHVTKYVNQCRINRNTIVHGWARLGEYSEQYPEHIKIVSKAHQRRSKRSEFPVTLKDVARVCDEIEVAGQLSVRLEFLFAHQGIPIAKRILGDSWRTRLFAKPVLPKLVSVNQNTNQKQPNLPQSFQRRAQSGPFRLLVENDKY